MKKWLSLFLIETIIITGAASVSAASTPAETTASAETPAAEDLPNPVPVVITMKEKGGYSNDQYGHAYRSENREDYPDLADSEKK